MHLELPPYFDYRLAVDTPLPECDPANDVRVDVTLAVTIDGVTSPDQPTFDNCTFQRAGETATGPAALAFTFTVPGPPGTTTTTSTTATTTSTTTSTTLRPPGPNACAGAKLNAAGKAASCLLAQHAKVAKNGASPDPRKLDACTAKLSSAFTKAETKKAPCLTTDDAAALLATIDGLVGDLTAALDVAPDPSTCQSKKLKAAGTAAKCLLALDAKQAAKGAPKDPAKVAGCTDVLGRAVTKAEGEDDCGAATGDATAIRGRVEQAAGDVVTALVPR